MDEAAIKEILINLIRQLADMLNNPEIDLQQKIRISQALTTAINTYIKVREEFGDTEGVDIAQILSKLDKTYRRIVEEEVDKQPKIFEKLVDEMSIDDDTDLEVLIDLLYDLVADINLENVDDRLAEIVFQIHLYWIERGKKPNDVIREWMVKRYG